jgi:hypothetical protein
MPRPPHSVSSTAHTQTVAPHSHSTPNTQYLGICGRQPPNQRLHSICKWVKPILWLGCYGCIFHGTGNSAQLCQNFGISGEGLSPSPHTPSVRHCYTSPHNATAPNRSPSSQFSCCHYPLLTFILQLAIARNRDVILIRHRLRRHWTRKWLR